MSSISPTLVGLAGVAAAGWAVAGAARLPGGRREVVLRGLLGGAAAFGIALAAYDLLFLTGVESRWELVLQGGRRALVLAALIGLVEEGAKLAGLALAIRSPERSGIVMGTTVGVAAGFAGLESVAALHGGLSPEVMTRTALAPVAHALLAAPLGFGLVLAARHGRRVGAVAVPAALALAALLHAAGDLSLAAPRYGRIGFAAPLLAPLVAAFLHARRYAWAPLRREPAAPKGP
jgi:RsiW-degrading membrane proteinase PrsW (M82 family)